MNESRFRDLRTTDELKEIYRFPSVDAVRMWIKRHRVPVYRRGRILLADTRDVDAVMRKLSGKHGDSVPQRVA